MSAFSTWKRTHSNVGCYTGGSLVPVANSADGEDELLTISGSELMRLNMRTGQAKSMAEDENSSEPADSAASGGGADDGAVLLSGDDILTTACGGLTAASVHSSGKLQLWNMETGSAFRVIKAPASVASCAAIDRSGRYVAVGTSTGLASVWDTRTGALTHTVKGLPRPSHITYLQFHPGAGVHRLLIGTEAGAIAQYSLTERQLGPVVREHYSAVTSIMASPCGSALVSVSRDGVLNTWSCSGDLDIALLRAVPAGGAVSSAVLLHALAGAASSSSTTYFLTAGEDAHLCVWCLTAAQGSDASLVKCGDVPLPSHVTGGGEATRAFVSAAVLGQPVAATGSKPGKSDFAKTAVLASAAHLLTVLSIKGSSKAPPSLTVKHCLPGFNDQCLAVAAVPAVGGDMQGVQHGGALQSGHAAALATNSELLQVTDTRSNATWFLSGHTDVVLSLAVSADGKYIVSGSKDNTVRLWCTRTLRCLQTGEGHAESVGAVCLPTKPSSVSGAPLHAPSWIVSGAKDLTLKVWSAAASGTSLSGKATVKAHTKDINGIACAPNDKLVATASQDKSIKLWQVPSLQQVGTLTGHKRGVWACAFSPTEQVLASASGDNTVRIWDLATQACVATLEGHESSALCVKWLPGGLHLASASGDGQVKVWAVKAAECIATFEAHTDRIWSMDVVQLGADKRCHLLTAGGDSALHVWGDVSEEAGAEQAQAAAADAEKQQALLNAMFGRKYDAAIALCLDLGFTARLRDILVELTSVGVTPPQSAARRPTLAPAECKVLCDSAVGPLPTPWHAAVASEVAALDVEQGGGLVSMDAPVPCGSGKGAADGIALLAAVLLRLSEAQIETLLTFVRGWVTQGRFAHIALLVFGLVVTTLPQEQLDAQPGLPHTVAAVLPYTKRHQDRYKRLLQNSFVLKFVLAQNTAAPTAAPEAVADEAVDTGASKVGGSKRQAEGAVEEAPAPAGRSARKRSRK